MALATAVVALLFLQMVDGVLAHGVQQRSIQTMADLDHVRAWLVNAAEYEEFLMAGVAIADTDRASGLFQTDLTASDKALERALEREPLGGELWLYLWDIGAMLNAYGQLTAVGDPSSTGVLFGDRGIMDYITKARAAYSTELGYSSQVFVIVGLCSIPVLILLIQCIGATRMLNGFALLLPAERRELFVAEAQGNLGDCDHWWPRVDHLAGLALGMPWLAWMMWRDNRRGRA